MPLYDGIVLCKRQATHCAVVAIDSTVVAAAEVKAAVFVVGRKAVVSVVGLFARLFARLVQRHRFCADRPLAAFRAQDMLCFAARALLDGALAAVHPAVVFNHPSNQMLRHWLESSAQVLLVRQPLRCCPAI